MTTAIRWSMTDPSVWPAIPQRAPGYSTPASTSRKPSRLLKVNVEDKEKVTVFLAVETMADSVMAAEEVLVVAVAAVAAAVVPLAVAAVVVAAVVVAAVVVGTGTPAVQLRHSS